MIPIAAALTTVPLLIAGVPLEIVALVPVPIVALFLGWLPHNDLAYDSTAVWMHIASGVRGVSDRVGRLVPVLLIGMPLLAIAIPVAISVHGRWALLPAMVGVCASLFLSGLGCRASRRSSRRTPSRGRARARSSSRSAPARGEPSLRRRHARRDRRSARRRCGGDGWR